MAALMTSAAVPCMTKLTASRSPKPRVWRFDAFSSGTGRRRPKSVVACPSRSACSIVRWMKSWTCGKRARYVSMYVWASSRGMLEVLREPEGGDAVDDPEVDHLGHVALVLRQLRALLAEHLGGRRRVDVLARREGLAELRLAGDVREDPQLDLRVVGREQPEARLGDEGAADLAPELGADGDRLQVRIRGREPPRRGDGLVEGRCAGGRPPARSGSGSGPRYVFRSFEYSRHSSITATISCSSADRAQHARVGRVAGLALAARGQAEHLEEDARHLLGRAEHELLAGELVRARLELLHPVGEPGGDLAHAVRVDAGRPRPPSPRARALSGSSIVAVERVEAALRDPRAERRVEAERRRGVAHERRGLLVRAGGSGGARSRTRRPGRRARTTTRPGSIR